MLCPITRDIILSPVMAVMIVEFIAGNKFDVGEFLSHEMRDRAVGSEKLLITYPCMLDSCVWHLGCRNSQVLIRWLRPQTP